MKKTIKLTIDAIEYKLDVFEANGTLLTTDVTLLPGTHNLTHVEMYDGDKLLHSSSMAIQFTTISGKPFELPIDFEGKNKISIRGVASVPGFVYVKTDKEPTEKHKAKFVGVLGIHEGVKHLYGEHNITDGKVNKIQLIMDVVLQEIAGNKIKKEKFFHHIRDVHDGALVVEWDSPKKGNTINIKFQFGLMQDSGQVEAVSFDKWQIVLNGDEEPLQDENGVTTVSLLPDKWIGSLDYNYTY